MRKMILNVNTPQLVDGVPVRMQAKRYIPDGPREYVSGLTLLFAHGSSHHKEIWEPIIERLFQYQTTHRSPIVQPIREAWSLDCPSHGESAILNRNILYDSGVVTAKEWAAAIAEFCKQHLASHHVVCIGHSAGAYSLINSTRSFANPFDTPYDLMLLVEPGIVHRHVFRTNFEHRQPLLDGAVASALRRRQRWDSREEAFTWLRRWAPWNSWDPRMLRVYTEYGMRFIHEGATPVILNCTPSVESRCYAEIEETIRAMEQVEILCERLPVHAMFGEYNDLIPDYYNDCIYNLPRGRTMASVTVMPDAGHLIPQEKPDALAEYLWCCIVQHAVDSQGSQGQMSGTIAPPSRARL